MSLGGFAENESVVDGEYEAFNYCLAENYYDAMISEEWGLLDDMGGDLVENIMFWLSYDDEIIKENNYNLQGINDGSLVTVNGRTLIDAIIDEKIVHLAETYIRLGVKDPRLYVLFMLRCNEMFYYKDKNSLKYVYGGTILNAYCYDDREDLIKFLSDIFAELDKMYNNIMDIDEKKEFLNIVRFNIRNFKFSKNLEKISFGEVCSPGFARLLINK